MAGRYIRKMLYQRAHSKILLIFNLKVKYYIADFGEKEFI